MTVEEQDEFLYSLKGKKKGGHMYKWCHCSIARGQIIGIVRDSPKYKDGQVIRCSKTVEIHELNGKKILETLNSYYYLEDEGNDSDLYDHHVRFYKSDGWLR